MAAIPKRLRDLLDHYRLRWRVVQATMGLLMMFCAILGGAGLGVLVDRVSLGAPRGVRWAFLVVIALAAVALLLRRVLAPVSQRMADERTADAASGSSDQRTSSRVASPEGAADDCPGERSEAGAHNGPADRVVIVRGLTSRAKSARRNQESENSQSFVHPHGSIPFDAGRPARSAARPESPQFSVVTQGTVT